MTNNIRHMKTPYFTLEAKKNNSSKPYLMISELIDNSIGSWKESDIKEDLIINLEIDNKEKKIICEDNATGMSPNELLDSVELNKEKPGNKMNMFGVGMKNAAFWFGQDLIITTNNSEGSWSTSVLLSQVKDKNEAVQWKLENQYSKLNQRGTRIEINNMYNDKLLVKSQIDKLIKVLGIKYRKYIENNKRKVIVNLKIIDKIGNVRNETLESSITHAQKIEKQKVKDFISNLEKEFVDENEIILIGLKDKAIQAVNSGNALHFNFDIYFNEHPVKLEIGITSQPGTAGNNSKEFKSHYGITAYQNDRAIRMAGVNEIKFKNFDYTRTNIKRVFAFCELGHIFRPDNNKQNFNFGEYIEDFEMWVNKIAEDIIKLSNAVTETIGVGQRKNAGNTPKTIKGLNNSLDAKSTNFVWEINSIDSKMSFIDSENNKWNIEIHESDNHDDIDFLKAELFDNKKIIIKFNIDHRIWKPIVNDINDIDLKTVTYPLIVILGLAQIGIEHNLANLWLGKNGDGKNYLDIITSIAKFGLKI